MIQKVLLAFAWETISDFTLEEIDKLVKRKGKGIF